MKVAFRVDASSQIGAGHVMRCRALAGELSKRGAEVHFISRALSPWVRPLLRAEGVGMHALTALPPEEDVVDTNDPQTEHASWLGVPWQQDADETEDVLRRTGRIQWVIVDHYGIDARWHTALACAGRALLVIDDLANRRYAADWLLDPTPGREPVEYLPYLEGDTELLLGPDFALLRPSFARLRSTSIERRSEGVIRRVLIAFGGSDPYGATLTALKGVQQASSEIAVDVVIGTDTPARAQVQARVKRMGSRVRLFEGTDRMASLMAEADLALGAPAGASWERCTLGLPALLILTENNQRAVASYLQRSGAAELLGHRDTVTPPVVAAALDRMRTDRSLVADMSAAAAALTDGKGAERVSEIVMRGTEKAASNDR